MGTDDVHNAITQMQNLDHLDALRETDALLMADALGNELPEMNGDRSAEEVSGWDGQPLGLDEIAATNLNGFQVTDRPIQTEHDAELAGLEAEIAQLHAHNQQLRELADPSYQARVAQERELQIADMCANPERVIDEMARLRHQAQNGTWEALGTNLASAHRQHGRDFERAYAAMTALDARNPVDQALVRTMMSQPDPGRALMEWHGRSTRAHATGGRSGPPFARNLRRDDPGDDTGGRGPEDQNDWGTTSSLGDGNADVEQALMRDAWR
jgi:hypothetical protein